MSLPFASAFRHGFARVAACTIPVAIADPARNADAVLAAARDWDADAVAVADAARVEPVEPAPRPADVAELRRVLDAAQAPLVLVGGSGSGSATVSSGGAASSGSPCSGASDCAGGVTA